jgi:hypothetical protein
MNMQDKQCEDSMLEGGNHYLTNLKIKADANIGPSWEKRNRTLNQLYIIVFKD